MMAIGYPEGKKWKIVGVLSMVLSPLIIPTIFTLIWWFKTNIGRKYAIAYNTAVENGIIEEINRNTERKERAEQERMDDSVSEAVAGHAAKLRPQGEVIERSSITEDAPALVPPPKEEVIITPPPAKKPTEEADKTEAVPAEVSESNKKNGGKLDWN